MPIIINDCVWCEIPPKLEINLDTKQLEIYCEGRCEKSIRFHLTSDLWKENPMDAVKEWNDLNVTRKESLQAEPVGDSDWSMDVGGAIKNER